MISTSILTIKNNIEENLSKLDSTTTDFFHIDIMDGIFVSNNTPGIDVYETLLNKLNTPLDIHLMVKDIKKYVDDFAKLKPLIITFHYEACDDIKKMINYIKSMDIKVGIAISPETNVDVLNEYLNDIDLVLVMSVNPGSGGQEFIYDSAIKINKLHDLRKEKNYSYLIEVDGGINDITSKLCLNADILVVGSFITDSEDYSQAIEKVKKTLD